MPVPDIKFYINKQKPKKCSLLIAEPLMLDQYFKRAVIFLVEHTKEGTVGFILNKQIDVKINEVLPGFPNYEFPFYFGGPVNREQLFYIHTKGETIEESIKIRDGLYWGGNFDKIKELIRENTLNNTNICFFAGYSGWDAGQLENEMEQKSWIVSTCENSLIMQPNKTDLWKRSIAALGREFKHLSDFPEDPSYN